MTLQFDLASIQNFTYNDVHYLIGVKNLTTTDSLVLINLTTKAVIKEISLDFKVQKFSIGSNLSHSKQFSSDENQSQNSIYFGNMIMGYS